MDLEIERRERKDLAANKGWILVYGRRKVGKTYMLRRYVSWDIYILALKTGQFLIEKKGEEPKVADTKAIDDALS
ncbi:MAG: hypothetical protein QXK65_02695, partial [Candidatus Micrarchaeaceae archaeon]